MKRIKVKTDAASYCTNSQCSVVCMLQAFLTTSALNETTNGVLEESPPRSGHRVPAQSVLHQMNQNIISQTFFLVSVINYFRLQEMPHTLTT